MYLLDTNVISELRKQKPHGAVVTFIECTLETDLYLSAVTLGEIQAGIEMTRGHDLDKAKMIEAWADQLAASYHILPMDAQIFRIWAKLMHKKSDSLYEDAMIAATAIAHQLTVVTRNTKDFTPFNVPFFNPFS